MHRRRTFARLASSSILSLLLAGCGGVEVASGPPCGSGSWMSLLVFVSEGAGDYSPGVSGECVSRAPAVSATGEAWCVLLVAQEKGPCDCASVEGVVPVAPEHAGVIDEARQSERGKMVNWSCVCEIPQLSPGTDAGRACQEMTGAEVTDSQGTPVSGWCYIDATSKPAIGNPEILTTCAEGWKRMFRFLGAPFEPSPSSSKTFIVSCPATSCT
jgi:hypothetical protein